MFAFLFLVRFTFRLPEGFGVVSTFTQKLDHFDPTSKETFAQRYALNETFYRESKPKIIVYISGEQHMSESKINNTSSFIEVAQNTGSLMAVLEHRFYGESVPLDLTLENLMAYHNTDQALEDLASFISYLKDQKCKADPGCPVLIVGGSYAGSLSSFFRQKYPHLANYSWSSSPPLNIKHNYSEYDAHMAEVLQNVSMKCYTNTREWFNHVDEIARQPESPEYRQLREKMGLINSTNPVSLLSILVDQIAGMIQYMTRSTDLYDFCKNQSGDSFDEHSFLEYFRATNPDPDADDSLLLNDTSRNSTIVDSRSWTWQCCNEYGWWQTASGLLRSPQINLSYSDLICETLFGVTLADQSSIRRRYGDVNPKTTNILFSYGAVDPWTRLGVNFETEITNGVPVHDGLNRYAFFIANGSHCSDLSLEQESDSEDLKSKRHMIQKIVTDWMNDDCPSRCSVHGDCMFGTCVCHEGYSGDKCDVRTIRNIYFKECSAFLVLGPTVMMLTVGIAAWCLFNKDKDEHEIRTLA